MSVSVTLILSTVAKLARNQFNDLQAPGTGEYSADRSLKLLVLSQGHAEFDQCVVFSMTRSDGYR
jgi:hypothetical protein